MVRTTYGREAGGASLRPLAAALALLLVPALATAALAHSHKKSGLVIEHPWTPETTDPRTVNVPVYMTIKNKGRADRLVGATAELADKVEIVVMREDGGRRLPMAAPALSVGKGASVTLGPVGSRLLLSGFKKALIAYDTFPMTLTFERAGRVDIEVAVEEAATTEPHKH